MLQWHPRLVALVTTLVLIGAAVLGGLADYVDNIGW